MRQFANNASTVLSAGASAGDSTLTVYDATEFPALASGDYFRAVIEVATGGEVIREVVEVTAISGSTLTVTRGLEGTSARAWPIGALVELRATAGVFDDLITVRWSDAAPGNTACLWVKPSYRETGFVVAGSVDATVRRIDQSGIEVWSFTGHTDEVHAVAVDGFGYVYSAAHDGTLRKIDSDGNEVWSFTGVQGLASCVAVGVDGHVYVGDQNFDELKKVDSDGNEVWTFTGHTNAVKGVAVDADGYVYTASADQTVRKIDSDGNEVWSFTGHTNDTNAVAVDADGFVYTGSDDTTVRKIDSDGNEVWSFTGHTNVVESVAVDADGYVYTASSDQTVRKIDSGGTEVWNTDTGNAGIKTGVAVDVDGAVYVSNNNYDSVTKVPADGGANEWVFAGFGGSAKAVAVQARLVAPSYNLYNQETQSWESIGSLAIPGG